MDEYPDGAIFIVTEENNWAYMCAHCDDNRRYPGRDEAYVWHRLVDHLATTHGIRRTWIGHVEDRVASLRQIALPLVFNQHAKARAKNYRYNP